MPDIDLIQKLRAEVIENLRDSIPLLTTRQQHLFSVLFPGELEAYSLEMLTTAVEIVNKKLEKNFLDRNE